MRLTVTTQDQTHQELHRLMSSKSSDAVDPTINLHNKLTRPTKSISHRLLHLQFDIEGLITNHEQPVKRHH